MSSNFVLARSKDKEILDKAAVGGAVTGIFKYLLDNKIVDGVLALSPENDIYDGLPVLLTDSSEILNIAGSYHCAPTMIADLISKYLRDKKIAVSVKPCDAMAINELIKRHRINPDNIYTIGLNCGGTVSPMTAREMIELYYDVNPDDVIEEEIAKGKFIIELKDGSEKAVSIDDLEENGYGRRENCQRCSLKIPRNADLACGNWGSEDGWTFIEINTDKGQEIIDGSSKEGFIETKKPSEKSMNIREKIENVMIKMGNNSQEKTLFDEFLTSEEWEKEWNKCIKCYGCRDVCPICWCNDCELEHTYFEDSLNDFIDPLTFYGVRLSHMGFSCVNCGQCDDVCPMEIPISKMFDKLQKKYKNRTGYIAGVSTEKPQLYSPEKEFIE